MSIELRDVSLLFGKDTHIYKTNLTLVEGGFNILLGTTLSGKTSLLRLMAGLEKPSTGEIWFNSKNVTSVAVQKRQLAMVYQQFINYPNMTVYENIASPLRVAKVSQNVIQKEVAQVAELLKLGPFLQRMPSELSGGQQQRIALARALIKKSKLILLDEPLANLDYKLREELREELPKLFKDQGSTVVYATTEPMEALLLGGHTATLHQGHVTQFGPTTDIFYTPNNLMSAQVFSDPPINMARVHKNGQWISLDENTRWLATPLQQTLADGEYIMGFRPHHLTVTPQGKDSTQLQGHILVTEISGSESTIHVKVGLNSWVSLSHGIHSFNKGETTPLFIQTKRCLFFDVETQKNVMQDL